MSQLDDIDGRFWQRPRRIGENRGWKDCTASDSGWSPIDYASQHEGDVHLVIRENDPALRGAIENADLGEGLDVAMNRFDIAADAAGDLAYRDRAGAGHAAPPIASV